MPLSICSDKKIVFLIVITVKQDQSRKLTNWLVIQKLRMKQSTKNYQLTNIDSLLQTTSQTLSFSTLNDTAYSITTELLYAYSQLKLHQDTTCRCNFNTVGGDMRGPYRFKTGFFC